jgi:hypothetical protein
MCIECSLSLVLSKRYDEHRAFMATLSPDIAAHELICLHKAMVALATGDLDAVAAYLQRFITGGVIPAYVREGDVGLTALWFSMHEERLARQLGVPITDDLRRRVRKEFPAPQAIDFRQRTVEL